MRIPKAAILAVVLCLLGGNLSAQTDWFIKQRSYPNPSIPDNALQKALQQRSALEQNVSLLSTQQANAPAPSPTWTLLGPIGTAAPEGPFAGRVTALAADSNNLDRLYLAASGGGVWRSNDAGNTWQALGDNLLSLSSGALVVDPRTGPLGTIYYGTGDATSGAYGPGILRSNDGGASWQQLSAQFSRSSTLRLALHPQDSRTLFAARSSGIWRSSDSGDTWVNLLPGFATDIVIDQADPRLIFAALGRFTGDAANGIYRSTDGGNTWSPAPGVSAGIGVGRISMAISSANPAVAYAVVARSTFALEGVYKTTDFGGSWKRLPLAPPDLFLNNVYGFNQGYADNVIAIDPRNPDRVYLGGVELYRSTDGGLNWALLSTRNGQRVIHEAMFDVAFKANNPDTIYAATDGGVYRSLDGGDTWTNLNSSLPISQFNGVAANTGASVVLGGIQGGGAIRLSGDSTVWSQLRRNDTGSVAVAPDGSVLYAAPSLGLPVRSFDGGATWSAASQGIAGDRASYYPPIVIDPANPRHLVYGTSRVWQSQNGGDSWTVSGGDLASASGYVTALAVAGGTGRVIYAGTSDGRVQASVDGGFNWGLGAGVPNRYITSITADPRNPLRAFFTASNFGTGHVFRTQDGGTSWQDISDNLPDAPANAVAIDPRGPVYVATDVGVFRSEAGNGAWTSFNLGLPNAFTTALAVDPTSNSLIAGTFGRGAFIAALRAPLAAGPSISSQAIINSASFSTVLTPGALASVFGTGLAQGTVAASGTPLPTTLANATVTVNGIPAPLFFVSPGQINLQIPFEVSGSSATLVVTTPDGSAAALVQLAPASPGVFPGSVSHGRGVQVSQDAPATAGEVLALYATGLGATNLTVVSGSPSPTGLIAQNVLPVTVTVGGAPAQVLFSGLVPGLVGIYQVNFVVPSGGSGNTPLVLTVGSRSSNLVTIAVR